MITSNSNPKVKHVRRLLADRRYRLKERAFVVEGSRWLKELAEAKVYPILLLTTSDWQAKGNHQKLLSQLHVVEPTEVSEKVMSFASDTVTTPGVLAIVPKVDLPLPSIRSLIIILDAVTNPGNLGTMLRTASAAGADAAILAPGCVDVYNPKVLRSSMGAHLRLPVLEYNWDDIERLTSGLEVKITTPVNGVNYTQVDWKPPVAVIIGGEAEGVGKRAETLATGRVSIPMHRKTESLSAAIAAGIILFEIDRQRRVRRCI